MFAVYINATRLGAEKSKILRRLALITPAIKVECFLIDKHSYFLFI